MALTKTRVELVAPTARSSGAAATREVVDLSSAYGGLLTLKITNNATQTTQCSASVLTSHTVTLPSAADAGTDWKTLFSFGGGLTSGTVTEQSFEFGPGVRHLEVIFANNVGSGTVTVEALLTHYSF